MIHNLHLHPLQNPRITDHFANILQIPRSSGQEDKVRQYVLDFAKEHNFQCRKDKIGNDDSVLDHFANHSYGDDDDLVGDPTGTMFAEETFVSAEECLLRNEA